MKPYNNESIQRGGVLPSEEISVTVYGLGKMGLPLAAVYADVIGDVTGVDIDSNVVEAIQAGKCHIDREPGLSDLVAEMVNAGRLDATTDGEGAASTADVHVVIVPTLVDETNTPDLSVIESVVSDIAAGIDRGDVVIVESTVPPRTCRDVIEPTLAEQSGLDRSEFGVAFCPERTSSGRAIQDIRGAYPKVVGGTDSASTNVAESVYDQINESGVIPVRDATTAESVKVFEGVYRDVNIALANELGKLADELGIDVLEAIEVANTLPMCDLHVPGAGVGGHCIPYYPYFLIKPFEGPTPLMETAREVNDSMPAFTTSKLIEGLSEKGTPISEATVVVLGLTYRAGVVETRHAPSIPIVEQLVTQGADVFVVDPVLEDFSEFNESTRIEMRAIEEVNPDAVVLVTAHEEFEGIDWSGFDTSLVIVDGRQVLDLDGSNHWIYTLGKARGR